MKYQRHCPGCFQDKNGLPTCPICGYDESVPRSSVFLPHGAVLGGHYRIGRVLGRPGGFGITYLGWDVNLQKRVAIKEYLPRDLASRVPENDVVRPHTVEDQKAFEFGKEQFLREARIVAQFDHPNIVRVLNFFNANETAYLVMDYYEGMSLGDYLTQVRVTIEPEVSVPLLKPILDGLQYVHERGVVHRDVKPHNIYLARIGRPILLDFGAARQAVGDRVASLSVVLTEGYAPLEQYQRRAAQGPWTDVYGVAATLYRMIEGSAPPIALDRLNQDPLENGTLVNVPASLAPILRKALSVKPEERYPTAAEFRRVLDLDSPPTVDPSSMRVPANLDQAAPSLAAPGPVTAPLSQPRPTTPRPPPPRVESFRPSADPARGSAANPPTVPKLAAADAQAESERAPARRRTLGAPVIAGLAVIVLAAISVGYVLQHPASGPKTAGGEAVPPPPAAAPVPAPAPASAPATQTPAAPAAASPVPVAEVPSYIPQFVDVPEGEFTLGDASSGIADEKPPRHAHVAGFQMSATEVTVEQFRHFIERSSYFNPAWTAAPCQSRSGSGPSGSPASEPQSSQVPVVCVSAEDAVAYANWLSQELGHVFRLPTEAEWEYASRAGTQTAYWWGATMVPDQATCSDCLPGPHLGPDPVRTHPANPFGLFDTSGNVREWTCSVYGGYETDQAARCGTPAPNSRLSVRGGDWAEPASTLRSAARNAELPEHRDTWTGFRLVSNADAKATGD